METKKYDQDNTNYENFEIDRVAFGAFVAAQRKEKGYTQKELADRLFVSDKAVTFSVESAEEKRIRQKKNSPIFLRHIAVSMAEVLICVLILLVAFKNGRNPLYINCITPFATMELFSIMVLVAAMIGLFVPVYVAGREKKGE